MICYVCFEEGAPRVCNCTTAGLHAHCAYKLFMYGVDSCSVCLEPIRYDRTCCTYEGCRPLLRALYRLLAVMGWVASVAGLIAALLLYVTGVHVAHATVVLLVVALMVSSFGVIMSFNIRLFE